MFEWLLIIFAWIGVFSLGIVIYLFFHVQGLRYTQECQCPKCGDKHWCAPDEEEFDIDEDKLVL